METLLETQKQLIEEMKKLRSNFSKDGPDRKTPENINKRITMLDLYWRDFEENHGKLRGNLEPNHDYLTGNYYDETRRFYCETRDHIQKSVILKPSILGSKKQEESTTSRAYSPKPVEEASNKDGAPTQIFKSQGTNSKLDEMLKKQSSNFKAFSRTISQIQMDDLQEKWEFEDTLKSLQSRWQVIDSLHWEIDSILDGSDKDYDNTFNKNEQHYFSMKKAINNKLWSVSHREKSTPQLDIPIFSGNYQQWVSFMDLFCEAVHNNPSLSNAQKMQFLKSKLRGEPERMIQHLQISSDNYITSWEILNHRYNNKKLIFTSYMNIMVNLPAMQQASSNHIKRIHDVISECLNAIKNLGVNIDTWDPILIHILSPKLDVETHNEYISSLKQPRELPAIKDFIDFLENKFTSMEGSRRKQDSIQRNNLNIPSTSAIQERSQTFRRYHSSNKIISNQSKFTRSIKLDCPICHSNKHRIYYCDQFLEMTAFQKQQVVAKLNLCKNCLFNHFGQNCTSDKRCRICNECHNSILHDAYVKVSKPMPSNNVTSRNTTGLDTTETIQRKTSTHVAQQYQASEILLATAMIKVKAANGVIHTIRALIDQGSQISLITEKAAQQLGLPRQKCSGVITGVGTKDTICKGLTEIYCSSLTENYIFNTQVFIMKSLTRNLPNYTFIKPNWEYLSGIKLADPEFYVSRPIDLLLGADVYANIILQGIHREREYNPIAQETRLGWILCGKAQTLQCNVVLNNLTDIQRFWEIEDITENKSGYAENDECIKYYKSTTTRREDGKYEVRLPLKSNGYELGDSKNKAVAQFLSLERKFSKNSIIEGEYKQFMVEYQTMGLKNPSIAY